MVAVITHAFSGVPFITAISFLSESVWIQSVVVMLSVSKSLNTLLTFVLEYTY